MSGLSVLSGRLSMLKEENTALSIWEHGCADIWVCLCGLQVFVGVGGVGGGGGCENCTHRNWCRQCDFQFVCSVRAAILLVLLVSQGTQFQS